MTKGKTYLRSTAVIFAFLVLLSAASSVLFLAYEACHECSGENCIICGYIAHAKTSLRDLSVLICIFLVFASASSAIFRISKISREENMSLFLLKTSLLD